MLLTEGMNLVKLSDPQDLKYALSLGLEDQRGLTDAHATVFFAYSFIINGTFVFECQVHHPVFNGSVSFVKGNGVILVLLQATLWCNLRKSFSKLKHQRIRDY